MPASLKYENLPTGIKFENATWMEIWKSENLPTALHRASQCSGLDKKKYIYLLRRFVHKVLCVDGLSANSLVSKIM